MKKPIESFLVNKKTTIKQAMKQMTEIGQKSLFVVDQKRRLLGSLSDGDVRKWIINGGSIREKITRIYNKKPRYAKKNFELEDIKKLMLKLVISAVPVVNENNEIESIQIWEDVFANKFSMQNKPLDIQVVIMAGGKGTRLDPFTTILPKSLIPIHGKPIIELIMDWFNSYGISEFFVSINHKARMIKSYFEDSNNKYKISYIEEDRPLGTAGSLRLIKNKVENQFLVTNCDIILKADCAEIIQSHKNNGYDMTLIVSCRHYKVPYGVCEIENGGVLRHINEKPEYDLLVNTGVYVMNKELLDIIPKNVIFNMNDLVNRAMKKGFKVGVFPISEDSWIDIGQWEEYHKATEKLRIC
ncbi:MAG: NTP transferase domain-containing protein [Candidatus Saganbacteria bacterium]|nr:NTP transferase domain-containing protein [Candidatus Saganbacteria bacterium]